MTKNALKNSKKYLRDSWISPCLAPCMDWMLVWNESSWYLAKFKNWKMKSLFECDTKNELSKHIKQAARCKRTLGWRRDKKGDLDRRGHRFSTDRICWRTVRWVPSCCQAWGRSQRQGPRSGGTRRDASHRASRCGTPGRWRNTLLAWTSPTKMKRQTIKGIIFNDDSQISESGYHF